MPPQQQGQLGVVPVPPPAQYQAVPPPPQYAPPPVPRQYYSPYPQSPPQPRPYGYVYVPPPPPPPPAYYAYPPPGRAWYGYGWGWGYYPIYPAPPRPAPPPHVVAPIAPPPPKPPEPSDADRIYTSLSFYGGGMKDSYAAGVSLGVDSQYVGFDISMDALGNEQVTGRFHDSGTDPAGWGAAHLTWSVISNRNARIRVLTGASMLALPDSKFVQGQPWAGKTIFGVDLGASGQIGLAGPLGIEGYARVTPYPIVATDYFVGLTVHGGPIGVMGGYRWVDIEGDSQHVDAPQLKVRGPQFGLAFRF